MRKMKKIFALTLVAAMTVSSVTSSAKTNNKVKAVKITSPTKKKVTLEKGESFVIKAKVTPAKVKNKKLVFKSSKKKVASVNSKGKVKAVNVGTAKITVAAKANKKKKATILVCVVKKSTDSTVKPSATPASSAAPSVAPSATPASSAAPSVAPSAIPEASATPVVTAEPSTEPTAAPTVAPTWNPNERAKDGSKRVHTLTLEAGETTRETVTSEKTVTYTLDEKAKEIVSKIPTNTFLLGIGAHNLGADFSVKNIQIVTTDGTKTPVNVASNLVFGKGGNATQEDGKISFKGTHNYYGMVGMICTIPAGGKGSDITGVEFTAESAAGNTLCVYAGTLVEGMQELTSAGQATVTDTLQ